MDGVFRKLRAQGVGANPKHAQPFNKEEENLLWRKGIIGVSTPESLFNAIFYYNGKVCCLRGGEEHRNLKITQFTKNESGYIYTENASKNRSGGINQFNIENKYVNILRVNSAGPRCHCYLLDQYLMRLSPEAIKRDIFYLRPLIKVDDTNNIWFTSVPVGRNKLATITHEMCKKAGIGGNKTNHSLRATGATELYLAGVPEKIIQERTGHRSLDALRRYENTNENQHLAVSKILSSEKTNFTSEMKKMDENQTTSLVENNITNSSCMPSMNFKDCNVTLTINQGSINDAQAHSSTNPSVSSPNCSSMYRPPYMPYFPPYSLPSSSEPAYMPYYPSYSLPSSSAAYQDYYPQPSASEYQHFLDDLTHDDKENSYPDY